MKRNLRKAFAFILALTMVVSLFACGKKDANPDGGDSSSDDTFTIAYIGPLTGEASAWGTPEANTLKLLVDQVNAEGGIAGKKVILNTYDNRGDNVETTNAAKKAIEVGGADVIVGCNSSGASLALASVCEEYKVPSVATCATNSKVTEDDNGNVREWTFRVCLADPALGNVMAKYAYDELGLRRIGILKEISSDYSVGISDNFSDTFTSLGGEIVGVESYTAGDVDFRAQMTALHQKTPDALFLPMTYKELALATVQARDLGMDELFLGPDCWMAEDMPAQPYITLRVRGGSNRYSMVVPDSCEALISKHTVPGETPEKIIVDLQSAVQREKLHASFEFAVEKPFYPSFLLNDNLEEICRLRHIFEEVTGEELKLVCSDGVSDNNHWSTIGGIPSVCFGPGGKGLHQSDEWVSTEQMENVLEVYLRFFLEDEE